MLTRTGAVLRRGASKTDPVDRSTLDLLYRQGLEGRGWAEQEANAAIQGILKVPSSVLITVPCVDGGFECSSVVFTQAFWDFLAQRVMSLGVAHGGDPERGVTDHQLVATVASERVAEFSVQCRASGVLRSRLRVEDGMQTLIGRGLAMHRDLMDRMGYAGPVVVGLASSDAPGYRLKEMLEDSDELLEEGTARRLGRRIGRSAGLWDRARSKLSRA